MNIEELQDKFKNIVSEIKSFLLKNKNLMGKSLLIGLGLIALIGVFLISNDEFSVSKEAGIIAKNIEERKYTIALENYDNWQEEFSDNKMSRLNKEISKKVNILLLEHGNSFISKQITKEHFSGMINTINMMSNLNIDLERIVEQASRISQMYLEENVDFATASGYMAIISTLNQIEDNIYVLNKDLNEINKSRVLYDQGVKYQQNQEYYEAIESYSKVLEKDKDYYNNSQRNIRKCIDEMYDYYISEAKNSNKKGEFEDALMYINYLKPYYQEDEAVIELASQIEKNLSLYTLSTDDIISLIARKSNKNSEDLSVETYRIMVKNESYYYVQLYEFEYLIDTLLIHPPENTIYSYRDAQFMYESNTYTDKYFKTSPEGEVEFSISKENAKYVLEQTLKESSKSFKSIESITKNDMDKYIDGEDIDKVLNNEGNIYYYFRSNNGWFKSKDEFVVNMYTKQVYEIEDGKLVSY